MKLQLTGNAAALKKWMADEKKLAIKEEKQFEKERNALLKKMKKENKLAIQLPPLTAAEAERKENWQNVQRFCDTRYILPVAVQGVVVNGLVLDHMLKKLSGVPVAIDSANKDLLVLKYDVPGGEGELELYDISDYFPEELVLEGALIDG